MNEFNISQLNKYINFEKEYLKNNELIENGKSKKKTLIELINSIHNIEKNIDKNFQKPRIIYLSQKRCRLKKINHPKIKIVKKTLQ